MRRTPLHRYTPLETKTGLRKMSSRTKLEMAIWRTVKEARILALESKLGYIPCEYCGKVIINESELWCAEGHHNDHNRRHNFPNNCRILHRICNQQIEDRNIKDVPSLL